MTAALRKWYREIPIPASAFLLGSVAPDIPLYFLSIGGLFYFNKIEGWPLEDSARHIFGTLYFEDPIWIGLHNVLHSPLSLVFLLVLCKLVRPVLPRVANWFRWFLLACLLHSVVDIFTHYDDGPLLFWPLDLTYRFQSPVSYWDHRHYGSEASKFELALVLFLIAYLVGPWIYRRIARVWQSDSSFDDASGASANDEVVAKKDASSSE